jgi:hypothetical protein
MSNGDAMDDEAGDVVDGDPLGQGQQENEYDTSAMDEEGLFSTSALCWLRLRSLSLCAGLIIQATLKVDFGLLANSLLVHIIRAYTPIMLNLPMRMTAFPLMNNPNGKNLAPPNRSLTRWAYFAELKSWKILCPSRCGLVGPVSTISLMAGSDQRCLACSTISSAHTFSMGLPLAKVLGMMSCTLT